MECLVQVDYGGRKTPEYLPKLIGAASRNLFSDHNLSSKSEPSTVRRSDDLRQAEACLPQPVDNVSTIIAECQNTSEASLPVAVIFGRKQVNNPPMFHFGSFDRLGFFRKWHSKDKASARLQHPANFSKTFAVVWDMLKDLGGGAEIERLIAIGQLLDVLTLNPTTPLARWKIVEVFRASQVNFLPAKEFYQRTAGGKFVD